METTILTSLLNNTALLLAMCLVYDTLSLNRRLAHPVAQRIISGIILGVIGIAVMINPWHWYHGIIFDTRSVLLGVAGLFFGPVPTLIAMIMTAAYRIHLGGGGALMGVSVILASGSIGILWGTLRRRDLADISLLELYGFGVVLHLVMLGLMALLPGSVVVEAQLQVGIPVMIIYPVGTALLGALMAGRHIRRRTEDALMESERNYREIFNATSEAIFIEEAPSGRFLDVNDSMLRMYGYDSKEEVLRGNVGDLSANLPPYTQEEAVRRVYRAIEEGPQVFEWLARKKSGELFWAEVSLRSSSIGGQGRILAVVRDISERKRAEEDLRESEERWQFALEGSGDGVWDRDIVRGRVFYSDQWKRMLGYEPHEIGDTPDDWLRLIHADDAERVMVELQRHLQGEIPVYLSEYRIRCSDGSYKWILARGKVTARDDSGAPLRIVGTHSDVTERKHMEEQLRQSQKMEAIGQLAGGIAHDFNNILTTIIGRTYLLQSRLTGQEDLLAHAEQVTLAAERASALTRSLLSFSRDQAIELRRISLNDAVNKASDLFSRLVREDIEITIKLADPGPVVLADEGQLVQLLLNLVTNSRDAIAGAGHILIETGKVHVDRHLTTVQGQLPPGEYVVLTVSDSGCGMDDKTRSRIFEPFYTTKEVGKGTGLGLSVVYGIVKRHDGHIYVRSEPGKGASFSLYLSPADGAADHADASNHWPLPMGHGTILVAEDEDAVRAMLKTILTENGYQVIEAQNGADAVVRFMEDRDVIDAVLLDVIMPRMNGREAYNEILRIRPDAKVLFMSGYSGEVLAEYEFLRDNKCFIHKPLRPYEIILQLQQLLAKDACE